MQEETIVEECKKGNKAAMGELYRSYAPVLFVVALRYLGERELAEDLLHDSFVKIFSSFGKFTWMGKGSLKAWMCRVTANNAIQYLREKRLSYSELDEAKNYIDEEPPDKDGLASVPNNILLEFIGRLPVGYRTVFNLYVFENLSHKEIAKKLGINERSSSSQLARAKSSLAKMVKDYLQKQNRLI